MGAINMNMLLFTALVLLSHVVDASENIYSRECRQLAAMNMDHSNAVLDPTDPVCSKHVCGKVPETELKFHERLSPQCSNLMDQYKSKWSRMGLSNLLTPHPCTSSKKSLGPHGPVLISSPHPIATFAMCSIPKVACTNFRKLLSTVMVHPDPMPTDSFSHFFNPHMWPYPTVWHYDAANATIQPKSGDPVPLDSSSSTDIAFSDSIPTRLPSSIPDRLPGPNLAADVNSSVPDRLPESVPSFIVGRNPYVRVLSGFLDKMVHDPLRHDQWTYKSTNDNMGLHSETRWENTLESFQKFVKALSLKGVAAQDEHFALASTMCTSSFKMDYYLRLEDMAEWFPCWMEGLGLRKFTERGWVDSEDGRMHVGEGEHWITEREPWRNHQDVLSTVAEAVAADISAEADYLAALPSDGFSLPMMAVNSTGGGAGLYLGQLSGALDASGVDAGTGAVAGQTAAAAAAVGLATARRSRERLVSGDKCWWSPSRVSCEEYYASFTLPDGSVVPGGYSGQTTAQSTGLPTAQTTAQSTGQSTVQQRPHSSPQTVTSQAYNVSERQAVLSTPLDSPVQTNHPDVSRTVPDSVPVTAPWISPPALPRTVPETPLGRTPPDTPPETVAQHVPQNNPEQLQQTMGGVPGLYSGQNISDWNTPHVLRESFTDTQPTRGLRADQHDHNAAENWQKYFDQETADLVFLLYSDDFRAFRYERFVVP